MLKQNYYCVLLNIVFIVHVHILSLVGLLGLKMFFWFYL